jgi:16S rRNA (cytidine1402-2'-O)-methyltransferase
MYEEIWRGLVSGAIEHFVEPRGEFTLVIEGGAAASATAPAPPTVDAVVEELRERGATAKVAVAEIVRRCGVPKRTAYTAWHREESGGDDE